MASLKKNAFKKQGRPRLPALYPTGKTETTKKYLGPWHGAPQKKNITRIKFAPREYNNILNNTLNKVIRPYIP